MDIAIHDSVIKNNYKLSFTLFKPERESAKSITILISPAMAVLQRYYRSFSEFLCTKGYYVITFDHIGTGDSKFDPKDNGVSYDDWGRLDIEMLIQWIETNLKTEIYYVAHSAGGQLLGLVPSAKNVSKIFIISSGIGYWKYWPFPRKYYYFIAWYLLLPVILKVYGYAPKFVMKEKVPIGIIKQWLFWTRKKHFMLDDRVIQTYFDEITANVLYLAFTDDTWAPYKSAKALASFYPAKNVEFRYINPKEFNLQNIGHFGFFRSKYKKTLWQILNL